MSADIVAFPRHRRLARRRKVLEAQAEAAPEKRVTDLTGYAMRSILEIVRDGAIDAGGLVLVDRLLGHLREVIQIKIAEGAPPG